MMPGSLLAAILLPGLLGLILLVTALTPWRGLRGRLADRADRRDSEWCQNPGGEGEG